MNKREQIHAQLWKRIEVRLLRLYSVSCQSDVTAPLADDFDLRFMLYSLEFPLTQHLGDVHEGN